MSKQAYELTANIYGGEGMKAGDVVDLDPKVRDGSAFWRTRTKPVQGKLTPATPGNDDAPTTKTNTGRSK